MARLRVEKLQEVIKQEISKILLKDIKDPRIKFVSVTGVELTDDLSFAKVYVSFYGAENEKEEVWLSLNKALGFIRSEIAKRIRLRVAPSLVFVKDTSLEYSAHIQTLLNKIKQDEGQNE
ncbi:MAG TPA: 30S ribosome-binding factor RbfA [Candidatus Avacidaminococcus intestinavium]|uniref:Ribosome-binding factor A n=1 Tax=Candidatus Avacidaminococcus intestinavium TaxID=2840684 RepID=A0A9D1SLC5_9FIRM|nr:30S ribosome-binding factor RbfA [Candidatus Avacidaminococcus intestinavium]